MLSVVELLKCKFRFWRQTPDRSIYIYLFVFNSKAKIISIGSIFSIKFSFINTSPVRSFLNFRKRIGNFAVLVCYAAAKKCIKAPSNIFDFTQTSMRSHMNLAPKSQEVTQYLKKNKQ